MKLNKFFMGMIGALALTACSNDDVIPENPGNGDQNGDSRFMTVSIRNTNGSFGKAAGDQSGDLYEEGLDGENAIDAIRFYFFGENGAAFPVTVGQAANYYECTSVEPDGPDMPNVEKKLKATIVLNAKNNAAFANLKSMVAVVNPAKVTKLGNGALTLDELMKIVENFDVNGDNGANIAYTNKSTDLPKQVMTSASYYTDQDYEGCEVYINPTKLKLTEAEALGDPVDVYVERVLAKVRMTAKWATTMTTQEVTYNGAPAIAIKLTKDGADIKVGDDQIYAIFLNWGLQMTAKESYLFKHVSNWTLGSWNWNDPAYHRSYWAQNPAGVGSVEVNSLRAYKHSDMNGKIATVLTTTEGDVTTTKNYDGSFFYVQENAADQADGTKSIYDPASGVTNRTEAYVKAVLVTVKDGVATELSLAEWGGRKYSETDVVTAMFAAVNNQIWMRKANGTETITLPSGDTQVVTKYDYVTIPQAMVELVSAEAAGKADDKTETSTRYMSYIQLKADYASSFGEYAPAEGETGFYDVNHKPLTKDQVNAILSGMPGAKAWRSGATYYYTDLTHLNNVAGAEDKGMYGVVRNHIYEVEINSVFGLGTPVLRPGTGEGEEEVIIPQKPDEEAYFLGARLNILSWRVVKQGVNLDW